MRIVWGLGLGASYREYNVQGTQRTVTCALAQDHSIFCLYTIFSRSLHTPVGDDLVVASSSPLFSVGSRK